MGIDPKLYLEEALRGYTTLAVGDVIELSFEGRDFSFNVTDIRPHVPAVSIWGGTRPAVLPCDLRQKFASFLYVCSGSEIWRPGACGI